MMLGHNYVRIASDIFPITPRNGWADICESCSCWEGYFGASSDVRIYYIYYLEGPMQQTDNAQRTANAPPNATA
jgi:hypothetical protein